MCSAGLVVTYHTIHKSYRNFAFIKVFRYLIHQNLILPEVQGQNNIKQYE